MSRFSPIERELDGVTYRGSLHVPDDADGLLPIVVLHHGFGSSRQEAFGLFVRISRVLAHLGYAAVAFDRAGHGESDGEFFDTTVSGDIRTAVRLVDEVRALPGIDADRVHLLGTSLGAVVASCVAAASPHPIASLTLISPAAVFRDEIAGGRLQGRSLDELTVNGYFDFNSARLGPAFVAEAPSFDVYGNARGYDGPVRVLHGDRDPIVPVSYALRYGEVYGDRAEITVIPGGDHMWSAVPPRDVLVGEVAAFLGARAGAARPA